MIPIHRLVPGSVYSGKILPREITSAAADWGLDSFETPAAAFAAHCIVKVAQKHHHWFGRYLWELEHVCRAEKQERTLLLQGLEDLDRQGFVEFDRHGPPNDRKFVISKFFMGKCNVARLPPGEIEDF